MRCRWTVAARYSQTGPLVGEPRRHTPLRWIEQSAVPILALLALMGVSIPAQAAEAIKLPPFTPAEMLIVYIVTGFGVLSVLAGLYWKNKISAQSPGTDRMQEVGQAIRDGAYAYLRQQVKTML
ncbi:MAG TPA: hypothetical protein VNJ09_07060, partial [Chthonomonadales bacterium]|nr:hypothetical protein [Chthonomonadales bacterium]